MMLDKLSDDDGGNDDANGYRLIMMMKIWFNSNNDEHGCRVEHV